MALPPGFEKLPAQTGTAGLPPGFVKKPPPEANDEVKLSFAQRMGGDLFKRVQMYEEIEKATKDGEQTYGEGLLQVAGKVGFGTAWDLLEQAVVSGARGVSAATPDVIEEPVKEATSVAFNKFLNTDIGQAGLAAAQSGAEEWELFRINNPRAARNIEAVMNIGMMVAPVSRSAAPVRPSALARTATKLDDAADAQDLLSTEKFLDNLVREPESKATRIDEVSRTTEKGPLRTKVVEPSRAEVKMASAVARVPGVSPQKTMQGNYNSISKAVDVEADRLLTTLESSGALIPRVQSKKALDLAKDRLQQSPTMVGDAAKSAERIINKAKQIVADHPGTSAGILAARKELDSWIRSQKPTVFDPASENAMSLAVREVRQSLNGLIEARNPTQGVKESLSYQSNLLRAMDNVGEKAAAEGKNIITRTWRNIAQVLPLRGEFNQMVAILLGMGGLGAAAAAAPAFRSLIVGTLASYVAGKAVLSSTAKRAVSMLLKKTDEAIKVAANPEMIKQLRLDRAALLEILDQADEEMSDASR